jgi:hypothetical protein
VTLEEMKRELALIQRRLVYGCGNNGCRIYQPKGMGTNAICHCGPQNTSRELLSLALEAEETGREWPK